MITALVPTNNSEKTIRETLESIKWVEHIFIVDSFSTDNTLQICSEYTDWIVQHEYINSAKQKNWAMEQINSEWTLQIDSDEKVTIALRDEIIKQMKKVDQPDGYRVKIKNLVWGKWVQCCGMYPSMQVRLFRTVLGRWSDRNVHAHLQGLNVIIDMENHFIHRDFEELHTELLQFSKQVVVWESEELVKKNWHWRWWDVTLRPLAIFLIYYFKLGGYKEGFRGFFLSVYRAFYSFMTYSRLYELEVYRGERE